MAAHRLALAEVAPEPLPGARICRYRIEVFGTPRAPWRATASAALADAVALGLASWDQAQQEHFLAVPVDMRVDHLSDVE